MPDRDDRLLDLAGEISDASPVDWAALTDDPAHSGLPVRALSLLARVRAAHRGRVSQERLFAWGPLEVIEELGRGHHATVYRAWDPRLSCEVALKLRAQDDAGTARQWLDEARRLARIRHPNVVRVLGADVHDGRAGIWMEFLDGATLAAQLAPDRTLPPAQVAAVGRELAAGLAAIHAAGMAHGDLSPRNVIALRDGRVVLLDLGAGQELDHEVSAAAMTPLFAAPELLEGAPPSVASDLYSLGALLYRLLSGHAPIAAASWDELRAQQRGRADRIPAPRDGGRDLQRVIERALARDPARRPASALEVERALSPPPRRARATLAIALAAALIALVAIGIALRPDASRLPASFAGVARGAIEVQSHWYRVDGGSREPLATGSTIHPGEQLRLELQADRDVHLYVLNEDVEGALFLLYPLPGMAAANPLRGGELHRLPGEIQGQASDWLVTSAGGRERFLVVAASEPLREFESLLVDFEQASAARAVEFLALSDDQLARLRGVGGVVAQSQDAAEWQESRIGALALQLESTTLPHGALWLRQVEFLNPR